MAALLARALHATVFLGKDTGTEDTISHLDDEIKCLLQIF
jgi:hypothetical protein